MSVGPRSLDEYVVRSILANNPFEIKEVTNIESLLSRYFVREEYSMIEEFVKTGNIASIKTFLREQSNTGEFLEVILFEDQKHKKYIVTVYDSILLEQDPQIINIYEL